MSVPLAVPPAGSADPGPLRRLRVLGARVGAMCLVELQKLRRDQTELLTRAIQPALWLLIFGETAGSVTPTPRAALVAGKAFAAGVRALVQAITMPLFFDSNALYPVDLMPSWLKVLSHVNPLRLGPARQVGPMRHISHRTEALSPDA